MKKDKDRKLFPPISILIDLSILEIYYEKCIVMWFYQYEITGCTEINLESTTYYTPRSQVGRYMVQPMTPGPG